MFSALLRVFPAALFGGWATIVIIYAIERVRGRPAVDGSSGLLSYLHPDHRRLIAGSLLAMAVLVPASIATTGGLESYKGFFAHIQTHKHTPLTNHMGLPTILSHNWEGRMRFTRNENLDDAFEGWKDGRNRRKDKLKLLQYGILAGLLGWIGWIMLKSRLLWLGPALSLPLVMCLTDLTCYYYSVYIAAAVLALSRPSIGVTLLATAASSVVLLGRSIGYASTNVSGFYFVDDNFAVQSYVFFIFGLLMLWGHSRPFSLAALAAWWNRHQPGDSASAQAPTEAQAEPKQAAEPN